MKNNRNLRAFSLIEISIVVLIIGILIVGVTQSSRLVSQAKVNSARTLTQSSPASSIEGLVFWVESSGPQESFSNENLEDGDAITLWNDINPQNSTRNNLAITAAPTYVTSGINSVPALTFDGSDDALTSDNFANITTGKTTIFAVMRISSALADGVIVSKANTGDAARNLELRTTSGGEWQFCAGTTPTCYTSTGGSSAVANGAYVVSVVYNNDSAAPSTDTITGITFFQNGTGRGQLETTTNTDTTVTGALTVGNTTNDTDNYLEGHLGEIIIYNRSLKKEERQSVEEYLGKKWGIKVATASY
ncbi:MAG: prepilin-type N-terminal cleavage/methylation domain-containing protein [Rickettsiales bacterium]|nr:prepilin-type N-terminal cleavage/methylation domain-containing protein [Rickettsiales bacterium]